MHQSVEVIKKNLRHRVLLIQETWFRNIISASCNLRHFPSTLSRTVSPSTTADHSLLLDGLQQTCSAACGNQMVSLQHFLRSAEEKVCENERSIFTQRLPYLEPLTGPAANTYTHNTHCAISCSLPTLGSVKKKKKKERKRRKGETNFSRSMNAPLSCANSI